MTGRGATTASRGPGGDRVVEGWATAPVRVGPLSGHQPVVPLQDRGRGDQAMTAQHRGEVSDQRGEHGSVGLVQARPGVGSAEYSDLVAQDEDLDVLGRRWAAEPRQEAEQPDEDQVEETEGRGRRSSSCGWIFDRRR